MDNTTGLLNETFVKWVAGQRWDYMLLLPVPGKAWAVFRNFAEIIDEIERSDGRMDFRWIWFVPEQISVGADTHLLVGGTSTGEWSIWARRWPTITGDPEARGGWEYSFRRCGKRLGPALREALRGHKFDIRMQIGPRTIRRSQSLTVNDDGSVQEPLVVAEKAQKVNGAVQPINGRLLLKLKADPIEIQSVPGSKSAGHSSTTSPRLGKNK